MNALSQQLYASGKTLRSVSRCLCVVWALRWDIPHTRSCLSRRNARGRDQMFSWSSTASWHEHRRVGRTFAVLFRALLGGREDALGRSYAT